MENNQKIKDVNWEKLGVYFIAVATLFTVMIYIADIKERIAKLEVKVEKLEGK